MRSIVELMNLQGRKALVTGGAGHIGFAVAEALVELGAQVVLLDCNEDDCCRCVNLLDEIHPTSAVAVPCDLANEQSTRDAVCYSIEQMGGLDIIIHAAAMVGTTQLKGWVAPFQEQTVDAWDMGIRINLTSAFTIVQEARDTLVQSGHGSVVFVSSIYGLVGFNRSLYQGTKMNADGVLAYSASKGGLQQLAKHFSTLLAPDVRVNVISPGGIIRGQPRLFQERYAERTPLKRMGTEEDMKGAIAFLASDLSAYVTGQNIAVDGGWTSW